MIIANVTVKPVVNNGHKVSGSKIEYIFNVATVEEAVERRFDHLQKWSGNATKEIDENGVVTFTTPKFIEIWDDIVIQ